MLRAYIRYFVEHAVLDGASSLFLDTGFGPSQRGSRLRVGAHGRKGAKACRQHATCLYSIPGHPVAVAVAVAVAFAFAFAFTSNYPAQG